MSSSKKRLDLQGIRGFAIISVLLFHFFPNQFPNGYLGVDQFFVLSGFLMCMLLTKTENLSIFSILTIFYSRRFKRILPLYLLIIFITVIALYSIYPSTSIILNQSSANKALLFLSNRAQTGDEDYYKKLSVAMDLFTHTWSLSVEIQFYFIVPFIFLIGNSLDTSTKSVYYIILGIISFSYSTISSQHVAFNSVFARIWQFLIGMIAFMISTPFGYSSELINSKEDGEEDNMNVSDTLSKFLLMISMLIILVYPDVLPSSITRPLFTLFTGILMLFSIDDLFLCNRFLTYFGDISYSLYLIHWPVYAFVKLNYGEEYYGWNFYFLRLQNKSRKISALSTGLLLSILLAILFFETYEKWYLSISNINVSALIIVLFILNVTLVNKDAAQDQFFMRQISSNSTFKMDGVYENMTIEDAERMNNIWNKYDLLMMIEPGCIKRTPNHNRWCDFKSHVNDIKQVVEGENGEFKIALFGNSYTMNHHKMVIQECRKQAFNISMYSEKGCEPLAADPEDPNCVEKLNEFVEYIKDSNPDYAFMFTRFFIINEPFSNNNTDLEKDRTYLEMRKQLKQFLPFIKKKLYILDSIPRVIANNVDTIVKNLKSGKTIEEISVRFQPSEVLQTLHFQKTLIGSDGYERGRIRHSALVKECGNKCELIDYLPLFWNKTINMVQYFDERGFSYFNSLYHLSPHGIEHVRPIYNKICSSLE
ncbi:hypothetical protein CRE_15576 [Caenorhabditis remanei]|uniref:Acyl_transf_3 domain-containing protein n=1 Tax=Caenorhabditis remanei TaxID=31234 RepID=E3MT14_CAERE|nr:hypothetical protein CRE_15576 [Caenorhabditis remanei]